MDDADFEESRLQLLRRHWAGAIAITALCTQYSSILMSSKTDKAKWNENETLALLNYLQEHIAQAGDGGNFKTSTFTAVAAAIGPLLTQGPVKTGKMCKTKWTGVCNLE